MESVQKQAFPEENRSFKGEIMGLFNSYLKEGPGIEKDAPVRRGPALFFEILLREAWGLVKLNLLFVLFCLPVVTIGPALGGMTTVVMKMVRDKNSYVWRDFWDAFRQDFLRFWLLGLPGLVLLAALLVTLLVYLPRIGLGPLYVALFAAGLMLCFVGGLAWIYVYPLAAVTDLSLNLVLKDALLLGLGCMKHSAPGLLLCLVLMFPMVLAFPESVPVLLLIGFSLTNFVACFAAWPGIRTYAVREQEKEEE